MGLVARPVVRPKCPDTGRHQRRDPVRPLHSAGASAARRTRILQAGEGKYFIREGNLEIGGRLPSNTHGGQLGEAYLHGVNGIAEAVRMLRGPSTNQPKNIENMFVTARPAVPTSGLILGSV